MSNTAINIPSNCPIIQDGLIVAVSTGTAVVLMAGTAAATNTGWANFTDAAGQTWEFPVWAKGK